MEILGQRFEVSSWRDVLERTLNTVAELEPHKFDMIATNLPRYVGKEKNKFKASRQLQNGYFFEVHLSAKSIQKLCHQAIEIIDLSSEDWDVRAV